MTVRLGSLNSDIQKDPSWGILQRRGTFGKRPLHRSHRLGRPGVDIHLETLIPAAAILHLEFIVNEGKLVGATSDDVLHLWDFRENKKPEIMHSLKFQRERITCLKIPLQSKWIYIGTERGNIHVVNLDSFQLSGYIINWNKAIELSRKTHPGSVIYLGDNPTDSSKILIAYETGQMVLWDLRARMAEFRYQSNEPLRSVAWHSDGKSFVSSHTDGSLLTWNIRINKPVNVSFPHSRGVGKDGKTESFRSIHKVDWKSSRSGDNFVIFSGGLSNGASSDNYSNTPSLTVIHGKTTTVLEMEHNVLDFIVICESQWESEIQDPTGIIVLLQSDLVIIDLLTPGYPCYPNPYPMDIHESPVTTCVYIANCPFDIISPLYSAGSKVNKKSVGYSEREWPVNGGTWGSGSCSYAEIVVTGHADGSVKFWDASSTSLQVLYKLKTSKPFERTQSKKTDDSDPYAVQLIKMCPDSRILVIAGASSQVLLFKFRKHETVAETAVLEIPIVSDLVEDEFGGFDYSMRVDRDKLEFFSPLRVKGGSLKKIPGYQIELVCLTPWVNGEPPGGICSLAVSSGNGLLGYGTETGVVIVDYIQKVALLSTATPDLYGTADPYTRAPKSPSSLKRDESPPDSQQSFDMNCATTPSGEEPHQPPPAPPSASSAGSSATSNNPMQTLLPAPSSAEEISNPPAKSPKSSWSNVKSLLSKGFHKKASLASVESISVLDNTKKSPTSEEPPSKMLPGDLKFPSKKMSQDTIELPNNSEDPNTPDIPIDNNGKGPEVEQLTEPMGSSEDSVEHSFTFCHPEIQVEDNFESMGEKQQQLDRPKDLPLSGGAVIGGGGIPPIPPPRTKNSLKAMPSSSLPPESTNTNANASASACATSKNNNKKSKEPPMSPTQLMFSASASLKDAGGGGSGGGPGGGSMGGPNSSNSGGGGGGGGCGERGGGGGRGSVTGGDKSPRKQSEPRRSKSQGSSCSSNQPQHLLLHQQRREQRSLSKCYSMAQGTAAAASAGFINSSPESTPPSPGLTNPVKSNLLLLSRQYCSFGSGGSGAGASSYVTCQHQSSFNQDKLDSTFSRSRSSSMSSLDNITSESIQCLTFVETFPRKNDSTTTTPTVWVGTSLGSILVLTIGSTGSDRQNDPLTITPSGTIFRLKGAILEMCFMDATGTYIYGNTESWKDESARAKTPTKCSSRGSPTDSSMHPPLHYAILVSEKQSRVVSLPSQTCLYKAQLVNCNYPPSEPSTTAPSSSSAAYFVIKAGLTTIKDSPCLVTYNSNGRMSVYSLPSLRILIDVEFVPLSDLSFLLNQSSSGLGASGSGGTRKSGLLVDPMLSIWGQQIIIGEDTNLIAKTFCFSEFGHGLYLSSPSEMQKFTISAEFAHQVANMFGTLYIETEFPERPKEGFFTGLFGGGVRNLDREELFGESSGKPPRSVAKLLPAAGTPPELAHLQMRSSTAASEVQRARMLLVERGEKLGHLEDKTAKMAADAENFSSAAHQLMLKYKDKKWYQL
ncbi:unnamed protein product [Allacma fusca]|uniref:V-SNARE coiled-coil homology domain-containing protein n=1 Tax=Allacma fusca TaxID=39272 RepID=A0A8J2NG97_9HEXA|nr:unnamed protein product [Allacma fusca]